MFPKVEWVRRVKLEATALNNLQVFKVPTACSTVKSNIIFQYPHEVTGESVRARPGLYCVENLFFLHWHQQEIKYSASSEGLFKYVFQSVETCGSVVTYESTNVSAVRMVHSV